MSNAQLDQFINALEGKIVPILLLATIIVGLLSIFLKWLHHSLFRAVRSARHARQSNKNATIPAVGTDN